MLERLADADSYVSNSCMSYITSNRVWRVHLKSAFLEQPAEGSISLQLLTYVRARWLGTDRHEPIAGWPTSVYHVHGFSRPETAKQKNKS